MVSPEAVGSPRRRRGTREPLAWSAQGGGADRDGLGGPFRERLVLRKAGKNRAFFGKTCQKRPFRTLKAVFRACYMAILQSDGCLKLLMIGCLLQETA